MPRMHWCGSLLGLCGCTVIATVLVQAAKDSTSSGRLPQTVAQRVEQIKQSDPMKWKEIPWVASLLEARRLSQQEQVPVFLFTHDGNIETGRC